MKRISIAPRPDWEAKAEAVGFTWRHADQQPYWDERAYYAFTMREVEEDLEAAAEAVHALCRDLVAEAVERESVMERLAIPEPMRDLVAASWRAKEPSLYGRFDFAYDGEGPPKLYEYNADTPTSLYEAAVFQWLWLEDMTAAGRLPANTDQFNSIYEALKARFAALFPAGGFVHFASVADFAEDRQTVLFLEDVAGQAGIEPKFVPIDQIGVNQEGQFVDQDDFLIQALFKLHPWEMMFREPYAAHLPGSATQFIEPAWKGILSNKGILPLLWERHHGHPNLLPAFFDDDPAAAELGRDYVRKPLFGREGANVELVERGRKRPVLDQGYGAEGWVRQALRPPPRFAGRYPVIGAWMVGDAPCGIGIREDATRVTRDRSRFLPHVILD